MNARFNRKNVLAEIDKYMEAAMYRYKEATGKDYDPGDGTAQIPKGNVDAATAYGELFALEMLWEDLQ
jgi:hypothetical protein